MTLDERQLELLKNTIRQMTTEVEELPMNRKADRLEAISLLYVELELPELAEKARVAAVCIGEGDQAYRDLLASQGVCQ